MPALCHTFNTQMIYSIQNNLPVRWMCPWNNFSIGEFARFSIIWADLSLHTSLLLDGWYCCVICAWISIETADKWYYALAHYIRFAHNVGEAILFSYHELMVFIVRCSVLTRASHNFQFRILSFSGIKLINRIIFVFIDENNTNFWRKKNCSTRNLWKKHIKFFLNTSLFRKKIATKLEYLRIWNKREKNDFDL